MERTAGEQDVVGYDKKTDDFFMIVLQKVLQVAEVLVMTAKCWKEEKHKPRDNILDVAAAMGVELLTEGQYRELQELDDFDAKTSSWIKTPSAIQKLGGALFADRRFDHVFVYHKDADSYYAARGFRGSLRI